MKKNILGVVNSTLLLVLTIACFALCSYAWFAQNEQVEASGMMIKVKAETGATICEYQVIQRDGLSGTAQIVASNLNQNTNVAMSEYDTVFTDRNVNTPIIIRVVMEVNQSTTKIIYNCACSTGDKTWTNNNQANGVLTEKLSNVLGIRFAYISSLATVSVDTHAEDIYQGVVSAFQTVTPVSYASVNSSKENISKNNNIQIESNDFEIIDGKVVLFIELDYKKELIEAFISQNGIETSSSTSGLSIIDLIYDLNEFNFRCE